MADVPAPAPNASPSGGAAEKGGNILTKRIGPLPVIGWVIVAVGVYLVYRYIQNRNASTSTSTPGSVDTGIPTDVSTQPPPDSTPNPTTTNPTGDEQWSIKARADLIRLGYDPKTVDMVLRRYLSGEQLDRQEEAMIDAAINLEGSPPGGGGTLGALAPPGPVKAPKPPKPKPVPAPTTGVGSGHNPGGSGPGGLHEGPGIISDGSGTAGIPDGLKHPLKPPAPTPKKPVPRPRRPVNLHKTFGIGPLMSEKV